jgi:hypothetical protein
MSRPIRPIGVTLVKSNIHFSPRAVAKAIGVSESSLKRWCDAGKISAMKTAGGHRRMAHSDIISFLRSQKIALQNPEAVGLPTFDPQIASDTPIAQQHLADALIQERDQDCQDLLIHLFVNQWPIEKIVDDVVAPVFEKFKQIRSRGEIGIEKQQRISQCCLHALRRIASFTPEVSIEAPKAICVDFSDGEFNLPGEVGALVLSANGWSARYLDRSRDTEAIQMEALRDRVGLLYVAATCVAEPNFIARKLIELSEGISPATAFVIGHAGNSTLPQLVKSAIYCDNLSQLVAVSHKLKTPSVSSNGSNGFSSSNN